MLPPVYAGARHELDTAPVDELLAAALVCEMTVVGAKGQPVTHPLIPLWDGERIYMTSSVLFSKAGAHQAEPEGERGGDRPVATGGLAARCTIQGDARIFEDDPHETWDADAAALAREGAGD